MDSRTCREAVAACSATALTGDATADSDSCRGNACFALAPQGSADGADGVACRDPGIGRVAVQCVAIETGRGSNDGVGGGVCPGDVREALIGVGCAHISVDLHQRTAVLGWTENLDAADCSRPVDVQADSASCAALASVSATGDAQGTGCDAIVSCITVSGTGAASNDGACGDQVAAIDAQASVGCIAVSGLGDASNQGSCGYSWGSVGAAATAGCVAASGTGNASNAGFCGYALGVLGPGVAVGCIAVSGTGDADNDGWCGFAYGLNGAGASAGCVAASGTGNAHNRGWNCGTAYGVIGLSASAGCIAVAGGDASNEGTCGDVATILGGAFAAGCVAVAGQSADNQGSCDPGSGTAVAIHCIAADPGSLPPVP